MWLWVANIERYGVFGSDILVNVYYVIIRLFRIIFGRFGRLKRIVRVAFRHGRIATEEGGIPDRGSEFRRIFRYFVTF